MKKSVKKSVAEVVKSQKRSAKKSATKWNLAIECLAKAKKLEKKSSKRIKKESVMVIKEDKRAVKEAKKAAKAILDAEREAIKTVEKNCKLRAKELSKMTDDAEKQALIAKLIKLGYTFDLSDPTKLTVTVNVGCTVVPKMKKLKPGAKAVAEVQTTEQPIVEPTPIEEATVIRSELQPAVETIQEDPAPTEEPIGDTFTDNLTIEGPTDEELAEIEAEESDANGCPEGDDIAEFRRDFYNNLEQEGDDSNL